MENNPEKKYLLEQALRDFDINILAEGAELALSENPNITERTKDLQKAVYGYYAQYLSSAGKDECVNVISANFNDIGNYICSDATVILDDENQEFVYSKCVCNKYSDSRYECKHIACVLMQYFIRKYGIDVLSGTDIEKLLIKNTGIEHPLIPGILRKSDPLLSRLTKAKNNVPAQNALLPAWMDKNTKDSGKSSSKRTGAISVECVISYIDSIHLGIEIKAGPKKHFIIRDITKLLDCYSNNTTYVFSNTTMAPGGRSGYEPDSVKFMDFFLQLYRLNQEKNFYGFFANSYRSDPRRVMALSGRDLDAFMQLCDGKTLSMVSPGTKKSFSMKISLSRKPSDICIEKTEFGAMLNIPEQRLIGFGAEKIYLIEDDYILSLPAEQWEQRKLLANISRNKKELYIRDADLPAVCTNLLPLHRYDQLKAEGFPLETFLPEIPSMEIYLDLPQDDLISCEIYALYASGKKYNIFDRKTDIKIRNLQEEEAKAALICPYFNSFDESKNAVLLLCEDEEILFVFLSETIPMLSGFGDVMVSDRIKKLRFRSAGSISVGVNVESGSLVVNLKSQTMATEEIAELLSKYDKKRKYTRLKNGMFITIDKDESAIWEALSDTFKAYGKKNPEAMKIPMFRALYLDELLEDRDCVAFDTTESYKQLLHNLKDETCRNYPVPKTLKEVLRPYQRDGFRWIKMLKNNGFGGILADDMGLGKTLQALTFLLSEKQDGKKGDSLRTIIITPASLVYNWQREIHTFTPQLTCCVIAGNAQERKKLIHEEGKNADILITSYDLLKRDMAEYDGITFANEIIDEAQFVKNQNTQAAKSVRLIESGFRLALTGTPIENRLSELWSIFDYLMPGFLYSYSSFRREIELPVIAEHDEGTLDRVRRLVHPFILRRLKKDVLKDLPDKIEETVTVRLTGEQRKLYDAYAERLRLYLDKTSDEEFHESKLEILSELTKLRQVCCGPEIFLDSYKGENAKKDACMELVRQSIDGGHKLLLFSQFTSVLDVLCSALTSEGISYHRIDGSVSKEKRIKMVTAFEKDDVPVFCVSLKAGGTGLNLTAADIVIHYDPWWNVAAQNQATDRAHRIGQTNTVTIYQILSENTIEEHIVMLQQAKAKLAEDVLEGEGISSILINKNDLLKML